MVESALRGNVRDSSLRRRSSSISSPSILSPSSALILPSRTSFTRRAPISAYLLAFSANVSRISGRDGMFIEGTPTSWIVMSSGRTEAWCMSMRLAYDPRPMPVDAEPPS
jgi:hypothetical protein